MILEPDRATFRRLIWLHIAASIAAVVAIGVPFFLPRWAAFDSAFEQLADQSFGVEATSASFLVVIGAVLVAAVVWAVVSVIGLFSFKRWARFGFWASNLISTVLIFPIMGLRPFWGVVTEDVPALLAGATFGAIVLLSYLRGAGAVWFNDSLEN